MSADVVSLFSGVGGFDYGFEQAGYRTAFQCEIDERCRSVLRRHFPDVPQWGDITTLTGKHIVAELSARSQTPDVIIWGSPCQDLSVAGKGAGLAGGRSGLFYEGIRIINEIRKATNNEYPRVTVWENVAGALSSNAGADFGQVIDTMADSGAVAVEWRVLDAQFFGIPHRRRRVFVIAVFDPATASRCAEPILAVTEGVSGDSAQGRPTQQSAAASSESSTGSTGCDSDELFIGFSHTQGLSAQPSQTAFPTLRREGNGHAVAMLMREREGKAGGGKGLLLSPEKSLSLLTANEQRLFIDSDTATLRRLTPIECERLMGWRDDWSRYDDTGREMANTHRYQMCGNGVASPVARWIAERLSVVL